MLFLKFYLRTLSISRYFWLFNIAWKPPNVDTTRSKTDIKNNAMLIFHSLFNMNNLFKSVKDKRVTALRVQLALPEEYIPT